MRFKFVLSMVLALILCNIACANTAADSSAPTKERSSSANKYLHISTNPNSVDVFVNDAKPNFATRPDYQSPNFIKVKGTDTTVNITLFQKDYADTTINVKLSSKDTSYLIVNMRQHYDPSLTEKQQKILAHRARRSIGHNLLWASLVPFAASAVAAYLTQNYIDKADDDKDYVENSLIQTTNSFKERRQSYKDNRSHAKTAKAVGGATLGTGIAMFATGLILSF